MTTRKSKIHRRLTQIWMNEGRKGQVILPDERRLDILIQPRLYVHELLDIAASYFKLKEKEYFGLAILDETGHYNWLHNDKKILENDLPRKSTSSVLLIYFAVRFYVDSIIQLRDVNTVELFYLNAKQAVFKGQIECDSETVFELAAHVLQATHGDYTDDETARADLKKFPIPTSALKEHPSIAYCEEKVLSYFKKLAGTGRGLAVVNYLTIVERLPTYGIHYYEVKDKKDIPWWLGISCKGIAVYDKNDKSTPRRIFIWKNLQNLYYRDKKFSIEVHDPKRVSVSRRTFGPGNVNVHAWFAATQQLTKCIWYMSVTQHQFYLDKKQTKGNLPTVKSVSDLASELSRSTTSLHSSLGSDNSRSGSSTSLPSLGASRFDLNCDQVDANKVQREMYQALKARREAMEELLKKKTEELKLLCIKEGELTGVLPEEMPLAPGEQPPQIRRRVGTAFSLSTKIVDSDNEAANILSRLELEYELQKQITNAAMKLALDKSVAKTVRKQRKQCLVKSQTKLKEMEKKLSEVRKSGKNAVRVQPSPSGPPFDDSERVTPVHSPSVRREVREYKANPEASSSYVHRSATTPTDLSLGPRGTLSPSSSSPSLDGGSYTPNVLYSAKHQIYPAFNSRSQSAGSQAQYESGHIGSRLEGSVDSGFSSSINMYNVPSRRTSRYDSNDELKPVSDFNHYETLDDAVLGVPSKHGSQEGLHHKSQNSYGSLERNFRKRNDRNIERKLSDSESNSDDVNNSVYGSKRGSRSEYNLSSRNNLIEVPVIHEGYPKNFNPVDRVKNVEETWQDSLSPEPSPVVQGSRYSYSDSRERNVDPHTTNSYSPRLYEGVSHISHHNTPFTAEHSISIKRVESPRTVASASTIVTVSRLSSPQTEVSKPFEMSDFYKYSEKLRRLRMVGNYRQQILGIDMGTGSPISATQHSDTSDPSNSVSSTLYHHYPSHPSDPNHNTNSPHHRHYHPSGSSSPFGSPVGGRHANPHVQKQTQQYEIKNCGRGGGTATVSSTTTTYHTVKERSSSSQVQISTSTSQGRIMYKARQENSKQSQYQAPVPLKCDPVRSSSTSSSSSSTGAR
ncbi:hypothetical protein ACJMK2_015722 [Sinanodonta woodiana]|uniref:FERM domain-containing protein n=1 Tax=Sinanodonta woodiana TaxID=1069815 RepID=A0ABD3UV19_SINWO